MLTVLEGTILGGSRIPTTNCQYQGDHPNPCKLKRARPARVLGFGLRVSSRFLGVDDPYLTVHELVFKGCHTSA